MSFLRFLMLLSLIVWLGGLIFFPVVAQTAFSVLPAQHLAAGPYVPERNFPAQNGIPRFHDLNPRIEPTASAQTAHRYPVTSGLALPARCDQQ